MAKWDDITSSGSVEDLRGTATGLGGLLAGGGGIIALILVVGLNFLGLNVSPAAVSDILTQLQQNQSVQADPAQQSAEFRGADSYEVFASKVLGSTNDVWHKVFTANGLVYSEPKLVLFRDVVRSGCGMATSAVGPHYCPNDQTIYLDERFFDELNARFGADKGDVAQAYVIAHEVGHHVQNQLGVFEKIGSTKTSAQSIEIELQSDCYAGVWAYSMKTLGIFENENEIQEALSAASAVGDDNVQQSTDGRVDRETWTHGSSESRVNAFMTGYTDGKASQCRNLQ